MVNADDIKEKEMLKERKEIVDWLKTKVGEMSQEEKDLFGRLNYILEVAPEGLSFSVSKLQEALHRADPNDLVFVEYPDDPEVFQVKQIRLDTIDNLFDGTMKGGNAVVIEARDWDDATD